MSKDKNLTFESGVVRLEEIVEALERGDLDLDKSLAFFEEGVRLSRELNKKLDEAEKKLELLLKDENGRPLSKPFFNDEPLVDEED